MVLTDNVGVQQGVVLHVALDQLDEHIKRGRARVLRLTLGKKALLGVGKSEQITIHFQEEGLNEQHTTHLST